ncbi:hypothetical protein RRG08_043307 [Elysia crispata]|uniref:Uncharacterized protein n=1 Tax=Elysia crispata TaxID=231223 RepID=A0AAE0XYC9_9GAST|nr:hypothetical protein RRG08_043307 [Elysia crispata]
MAQACEQGNPRPMDSVSSLCWPITRQSQQLTVMDQTAMQPRPYQQEVRWPVSEPWRRNREQPRCEGEGRCQGDARRCDSKYRYGVDDVGPCQLDASCKSGYSDRPDKQNCQNPCLEAPGAECQKRSSRCFEWPQPRRGLCPNEDNNADFRPKRANLNVEINQPERCPTCKRCVVDMACGPLGYNY